MSTTTKRKNTRQRVFNYLRSNPTAMPREIATALNVKYNTAWKYYREAKPTLPEGEQLELQLEEPVEEPMEPVEEIAPGETEHTNLELLTQRIATIYAAATGEHISRECVSNILRVLEFVHTLEVDPWKR